MCYYFSSLDWTQCVLLLLFTRNHWNRTLTPECGILSKHELSAPHFGTIIALTYGASTDFQREGSEVVLFVNHF